MSYGKRVELIISGDGEKEIVFLCIKCLFMGSKGYSDKLIRRIFKILN